MIELNDICKTFNKKTNPLTIFKKLNLTIETGKFTVLLGRSGSGKTTLLNMIGSIEMPDSGKIIIDGTDITELKDKELSRFRNEKIGYVFQSFFLESSLSVLDNVTMPLAIRGISLTEREKSAMSVLEKLGIHSKAREKTVNLSGGEKQRVCIARALVTNPDIILADEPTGNLDYETGQGILSTLRQAADDGKTVILVTHSQEDAYRYGDTVLLLKDGIISDGR